MKKAKLLLFPLSVLLLSGCTFNDVKNWFGKNVYYPVRNFIEDVITPDEKEEEKKEEEAAKDTETWEVVTSESVLADYSVKEDAPYKHVVLDFVSSSNGSGVEGHCVYNLDETDQVWKIDTEQSTGTSAGDTLENPTISDSEILSIASMTEEGATVEFKKSNLGRYQFNIDMSAEGSVYTVQIIINKFFYLESYVEDYQAGEDITHSEQAYVWSE